jgi:ArsR family metal-binding transcriptional regulator
MSKDTDLQARLAAFCYDIPEKYHGSLTLLERTSGEPIMTIHADGRITLREDAQPTEAAAACIRAMSDMIQDMIKNAVLRAQEDL